VFNLTQWRFWLESLQVNCKPGKMYTWADGGLLCGAIRGEHYYSIFVTEGPLSVGLFKVPRSRLVTTAVAMLSAPDLFSPAPGVNCLQFSREKTRRWKAKWSKELTKEAEHARESA